MKTIVLAILIALGINTNAYAGKNDPVTLSQCFVIAKSAAVTMETKIIQGLFRSLLKKGGYFEDTKMEKNKTRQKMFVSFMTSKIAEAVNDSANANCNKIVNQKMNEEAAKNYLFNSALKLLERYAEDDEFLESFDLMFGQNCERPSDKDTATKINFKNDYKSLLKDLDTADSVRQQSPSKSNSTSGAGLAG
jgi:hypothetical protein